MRLGSARPRTWPAANARQLCSACLDPCSSSSTLLQQGVRTRSPCCAPWLCCLAAADCDDHGGMIGVAPRGLIARFWRRRRDGVGLDSPSRSTRMALLSGPTAGSSPTFYSSPLTVATRVWRWRSSVLLGLALSPAPRRGRARLRHRQHQLPVARASVWTHDGGSVRLRS